MRNDRIPRTLLDLQLASARSVHPPMDNLAPSGSTHPSLNGSRGMRTFLIIWIGQLVSLIGSQLTGFAMSVWVYDETRSVLLLALSQIAFSAPFVILSPLAGVLADRWNRRTAMIVSDLGAGSAVFTAAVLYLTGT